MRYLKNISTGKVTAVSSDDDQKFYDLLIERDDAGRPVYVQTGAHDPAVNQVVLHGQDPPNGEQVVPAAADDQPGPIETNVQGTSGLGATEVGTAKASSKS